MSRLSGGPALPLRQVPADRQRGAARTSDPRAQRGDARSSGARRPLRTRLVSRGRHRGRAGKLSHDRQRRRTPARGVRARLRDAARGLARRRGRTVRALQAVLIGGYHGAWVPWPVAARGPRVAGRAGPFGATPGAGVIAALPASTCGLLQTARIVSYLAEQSAGQCGPCLNGLPRLAEVFEQLVGRPGQRLADRSTRRGTAAGRPRRRSRRLQAPGRHGASRAQRADDVRLRHRRAPRPATASRRPGERAMSDAGIPGEAPGDWMSCTSTGRRATAADCAWNSPPNCSSRDDWGYPVGPHAARHPTSPPSSSTAAQDAVAACPKRALQAAASADRLPPTAGPPSGQPGSFVRSDGIAMTGRAIDAGHLTATSSAHSSA